MPFCVRTQILKGYFQKSLYFLTFINFCHRQYDKMAYWNSLSAKLAIIPNDGKQTPMKELTEEKERQYEVTVLMTWIEKQL